jgi:predicted transcriptional regulator
MMADQQATLTAASAIRHCRTRAELSARALSQRARLGDAYVSRLESGALEPSLRAAARIFVALGMSDAEIGIVIRHEAAI